MKVLVDVDEAEGEAWRKSNPATMQMNQLMNEEIMKRKKDAPEELYEEISREVSEEMLKRFMDGEFGEDED